VADELVVVWQTRWTWGFARPGARRPGIFQSRFMDGTASITLDELRRDWGEWPERERLDFCQSYRSGQECDPDILRFLIANGDHATWPCIAFRVARDLLVEESVPALREWCESCEARRGANYYQAIAHTGDPEAHDILRRAFARVWETAGLMEAANHDVAHDACCCLLFLLGLGEDPEEFRPQYEALRRHPGGLDIWWAGRQLATYFEARLPGDADAPQHPRAECSYVCPWDHSA
jgi:hypothetical protein